MFSHSFSEQINKDAPAPVSDRNGGILHAGQDACSLSGQAFFSTKVVTELGGAR